MADSPPPDPGDCFLCPRATSPARSATSPGHGWPSYRPNQYLQARTGQSVLTTSTPASSRPSAGYTRPSPATPDDLADLPADMESASVTGWHPDDRRAAGTPHTPLEGMRGGVCGRRANPAAPAHRWVTRGWGRVVRQKRRGPAARRSASPVRANWPAVTLANETPSAVPGVSPPATAPLQPTAGRSRAVHSEPAVGRPPPRT